jgi:acetolactate synthase-1/2/3 large subunit
MNSTTHSPGVVALGSGGLTGSDCGRNGESQISRVTEAPGKAHRSPELSTIAVNGLPIKIVVMNNGYLGMVRQWQELFYNNRLSAVALTGFPDAAMLAGAYGFPGRTVEDPGEIGQALDDAVRHPGPYLLNVKVSQFECVYPMVPAGGAIDEMVLGPPKAVAI